MFGRQPIAGSCGGMKALGMETECEVCGGDPQMCEKSPFLNLQLMSQQGLPPPT